MSGRSNRSSAAPLVAPGLGQDPIVGAIQAAGRAIQRVSDNQHQIVAGTVVQFISQNTASVTAGIDLDGAPGATIVAPTMNGWAPRLGDRVMVLLYPPRGVLILGQISNSKLVTQQLALGASLQTYTSGSPTNSILYLNNLDGSKIISSPMRSVMNAVSDAGFTTTSTTYVLVDPSYGITLPGPASQTVTVSIYGQVSTVGTGNLALLAPELRDGSSAGAILNSFVASDTFSAVSEPGPLTNGSVSRTTVFGGVNPASGTIWAGLKLRSLGTGVTPNAGVQRGTIVVHPEL